MKFVVVKDYNEMSEKAALMFLKQINKKDNSLLGLATGSSSVGIYKNLIKWHKEGLLDFSAVKSVSLDEYVGFDEGNRHSYRYFMNANFFDHININKNNTHIPIGVAKNMEDETRQYEKRIEMLGGIDIQLLGIGQNGHIGFNEPNEYFATATHLVELDENTRQANKRFFDSFDDVPKKAISMGIGTIMKAKKIVVVAYGIKKAEAIFKSFFEDTTPKIPASILQYHADVTVVADIEAMSICYKKNVSFIQEI